MITRKTSISRIFGVATLLFVISQSEGEPNRRGKFLSIFNIVRFNNDACEGGDKNGTCYTEQECSSRGGENSGTCAGGYGVCCTFTLNCGEMSNENCTHFESNNVMPGGCKATICPCNDHICQLRLDFLSFQLEGPYAQTESETKVLNGVVAAGATKLGSFASRCLTDSFSVVRTGSGESSDILCGTNTGQHLYVEATTCCTDLTFQLGNTDATRSWNIKVTQYSCDSPMKAPSGCDQYFFGGGGSGTVESFNYDGGTGRHLASQDQTICVRRERGNCRICWTVAAADTFDVSGKTTALGDSLSKGSTCGGYGTLGTSTMGLDFVHFPGARKVGNTLANSNRCGNGISETICSTRTPFNIRFRSDSFEFATDAMAEAADDENGFRLTYAQDNNCP